MNNYEFIGWVPCLSGNLYFENTTCHSIGDGYLNINNVELNSSNNEHCRYIVVASKVDWKDFEADADGNWNVVMLATGAINENHIEGNVFLIPAQNPIWGEKISGCLRDIAQKVHDKQNIQDDFSALVAKLSTQNNSNSIFVSNFKLKKSGITYLTDKSRLETTKPNTSLLICRQSFYFIKYTFHKHKHHVPAESLTTIHKYINTPDFVGKALISDLRKALVTLSRDCDPSDFRSLFSSKGVLSYAKSLAMTCKVEGLLIEETYTAEKSYLDNIGESLEIIGKKIEGGIAARMAFNANFRSICIFAFALIAPFTLLYRETIIKELHADSSRHIVSAFSWAVSSERHIFIIVIIVSTIYYALRVISLRYGSPILALLKLKRISNEKLEYVLENKRSAKVLVNFLIIISIGLGLVGFVRLL